MAKHFVALLLALATATTIQATEKAVAETALAEKAVAKKVDAAKGQQVAAQICAACHGPDGNSPVSANPKLAGQHAAYLYKQIKNFKVEGAKPAERSNPIMGGIVAALADQDMRNIAAWFASQNQKSEQSQDPKTVELGQKLYRAGDSNKGLPACTACHGPIGAGIPAQFPRIGGQFAEYTEAQLKAFRSGERTNDPNGMMRVIALKMTDAEIKAVANYVAGLH